MAERSTTTTGPAYRFTTERLEARCWSPSDAFPLRASLDASDRHLRPWIPFMREEPRSLDETIQRLRELRAQFDRSESFRFAAFLPGEAELVGEIMLIPRVGPNALEIGYWIDVRHARQGYAAELTEALVQIAFGVERVARVEIHCAPDNVASAAIPQRLGFRQEATLRARYADTEGAHQDLMIWTALPDEFYRDPRSPVVAFDALDKPIQWTDPTPRQR